MWSHDCDVLAPCASIYIYFCKYAVGLHVEYYVAWQYPLLASHSYSDKFRLTQLYCRACDVSEVVCQAGLSAGLRR